MIFLNHISDIRKVKKMNHSRKGARAQSLFKIIATLCLCGNLRKAKIILFDL